jgi:hypothetical protein
MSVVSEAMMEEQDTKNNPDRWTPSEKESCKTRYGCEILVENGSYADVCTPDAPRDTYIIRYLVDEKICFDLVRGSRVSVFDMYYDKFGSEAIQDIDFGYGKINPKLWGYQSPKNKKRK